MKQVLIVGDDEFSAQLLDYSVRCLSNEVVVTRTAPDEGSLSEHLKNADWVIEMAGQSLERKQSVLRHCLECAPGLVTSDSSIISRNELLQGLPYEFGKRHAVTHFFFPLAYCPLVEVVTSSVSAPSLDVDFHVALTDMLDKPFGRVVFEVPDSPGFVANRLGLFLIAEGIGLLAIDDIDPISVDRAAAEGLGLPRTALFGTSDLIGHSTLIALLLSLSARLADTDPLGLIAPRAVARLESLRSAGRTNFIDPGEYVPRAAEEGVAELVEKLRAGRDGYLRQICQENGLAAATVAAIMRNSYGWKVEW